MNKRLLTGIQPSGAPHLGNCLGMIQPALEVACDFEAFFFIADYHALTTVRDPDYLRQMTLEVAAALLALGLDPDRHYLYRQSDIGQVFELSCILSCLTPKGMLNRGHAYKSAVQENRAAGRPDDDGVNAGTYYYPVLMAADILLFEADVVPVGEDNRQHLEIAREVIGRLNRTYGLDLRVPEGVIQEEVAAIVGLDGRKMSASYGNTIPVFAEPEEIRRKVMGIVTDSRPADAPKDPETDPIFGLFRHFGSPDEVQEMSIRYEKGAIGYSEAKEKLTETLVAHFGEPRLRYLDLLARPADIYELLREGAARVRPLAKAALAKVKDRVGIAGVPTS